MLFLRVTLGFGWCLEGSKPLSGGVDLKVHGKKRKRLNVLDEKKKKGTKTKLLEEGIEAVEKTKEERKVAGGDGVGEVGRLCIWSVQM